MRLFIWSIGLSIILLAIFAELAAPLAQRHKSSDHTLPVHRTLYVERRIDDEELYHILEATLEWNTATNGQVTFDIKRLPSHSINPEESVIIVNVTPDYPDIILLDTVGEMSTLGYFNDHGVLSSISLVDSRITDSQFTGVVLHELGHYLGLQHPNSDEHPEIGVGSLMYSNVDLGSSHITVEDMKQFCNLYHCDWKKFHGVPEVQ